MEEKSARAADIGRAVSICRREVLSLLEAVYGGTQQWSFIRSRVLTLLGDRGLEGRIIGILGEEDAGAHKKTSANRRSVQAR